MNTLQFGSKVVFIEGGFVPTGKDYAILRDIIGGKTDDKGSFSMGFNNTKNHSNQILLTVKYSKK